jgi:hypothetical protein
MFHGCKMEENRLVVRKRLKMEKKETDKPEMIPLNDQGSSKISCIYMVFVSEVNAAIPSLGEFVSPRSKSENVESTFVPIFVKYE